MRLLLAAALLIPAVLHAQPSLFVEELTWPEVRDAVARGKTTALYYAGSTEQNGPHMALGKHNIIARHVAGEIASTLGNALVYPVLPFAPTGDAAKKSGHMRFPGSVSLSDATFAAVAREVALSAIAAGFRDVVLMGDHGEGQEALRKIADDMTRAKIGRVHYAGDVYFKAQARVRAIEKERGLPTGGHAGIEDTSELLFLDRDTRWVRKDKLAAGGTGTGVDGDPRQASAELGRLFIQAKIDAGAAQIRTLVKR